MAEVEWPTLVFFTGLFVMVGALVETGVIGAASQAAVAARRTLLGSICCWGSAGCPASSTTSPTWRR